MNRTLVETAVRPSEDSPEDRTVASETAVRPLLDALDDADCRAVLEATDDEALSAAELSEACDLPLSTTYRKLDLLTDAGLLEERTRIRPGGKHASEYVRRVDDVVVGLAEEGRVELRVSPAESVESSRL